MLAKTVMWIVVTILLAAAAGGVGYLVGKETPSPSQVESSTLSILAAGSLGGQFPHLAKLFVNETPGVTAPTAAQNYEGSLDISSGLIGGTQKGDVAAVADFRIVPQLLESKYATWEVVFGSTSEVLAYDPSIPALSGIDSTNWGWMLANAIEHHGAAPLGVWNASTDPNGYNEIFSMELQGTVFNGSNLSVFDNFYSGSPSSLVTPSPSTTLVEKESTAAKLVQTGVVSAVITYRSYAVANNMTFVPFTPIVGLNATTHSALSDDANLSTTLVTSTGGRTHVHAAPILFAATVPTSAYAPNPALGAAFIHLLLSPQGSAILAKGGAFAPIFPGWYQAGPGGADTLPSVLQPDVIPMPGWAAALLT